MAVLLRAQEDGKNIFTMGNGGHGNTAAHMVNDIAKHSISSDDERQRCHGQAFSHDVPERLRVAC